MLKRILKRSLKVLLGLALLSVVLALGGVAYAFLSARSKSRQNLAQLGPEAPILYIEGAPSRDLNKNGKLDVYEDRRQTVEARVDDLLAKMTLEEKAGTMFINVINADMDGELAEIPEFSNPQSFLLPSNSEQVVVKKMTHFDLLEVPGARALATWQNNLQKLAERTRLGIPVTIASDPRSHVAPTKLVAMFSGTSSLWPQPLGFGAIGDPSVARQFGDIVRQEYRAVGIHLALHPMADLATEPRWPRIHGTFGEDAKLAAELVSAYIKGFQGDHLGPTSVACMTKHFPGGGPQKEGLDPHFSFQKGQVYPGHNFDYHLIPFEAAFAAGTAQIMPYYGVAVGQTSEDVGFAFNKQIITGLLRNKYHFEGVVCTDWGVISDLNTVLFDLKARAHGVERLSIQERVLKVLDAGVDQFGGESLPEVVVKLVKEGKVTEARIDQSVQRMLRDKFRLGLFDNPYVDVEQAAKLVGREDFQKAGAEAQRRSLVLLKNGMIKNTTAVPLAADLKIYVRGIDPKVAAKFATLVDSPRDADVAIIRLEAPFEAREGFVESLFHHGALDFRGKRKEELLKFLDSVPTIVNIYLDRPAVIPEIAEKSAALIANFGATDAALLDVIFGKAKARGKLPFEMPSSMAAVRNQKEDLPYDSKDPLYEFGFGLTTQPVHAEPAMASPAAF